MAVDLMRLSPEMTDAHRAQQKNHEPEVVKKGSESDQDQAKKHKPTEFWFELNIDKDAYAARESTFKYVALVSIGIAVALLSFIEKIPFSVRSENWQGIRITIVLFCISGLANFASVFFNYRAMYFLKHYEKWKEVLKRSPPWRERLLYRSVEAILPMEKGTRFVCSIVGFLSFTGGLLGIILFAVRALREPF